MSRLDAIREIAGEEVEGRLTRDEYLIKSNERLKTIMLKKIDTTMIGALDAIEKEINEFTRKLSKDDSITLREAYSRLRSKILDNGNNQKRSVNEEMKHYTVHWNMYTMTIPVKPRGVEYDTFTIVEEGK